MKKSLQKKKGAEKGWRNDKDWSQERKGEG